MIVDQRIDLYIYICTAKVNERERREEKRNGKVKFIGHFQSFSLSLSISCTIDHEPNKYSNNRFWHIVKLTLRKKIYLFYFLFVCYHQARFFLARRDWTHWRRSHYTFEWLFKSFLCCLISFAKEFLLPVQRTSVRDSGGAALFSHWRQCDMFYLFDLICSTNYEAQNETR